MPRLSQPPRRHAIPLAPTPAPPQRESPRGCGARFAFRLPLAAAFLSALFFTACATTQEAAKLAEAVPQEEGELLREVRNLTAERGLLAARERVLEGIRERDESRGSLEARVLRTTRDPGLVLPDSLAALPPERRARVALVVVPGTRAGTGLNSQRTQRTLLSAAETAREMGFESHFAEIEARGTVEANARRVAESIRPVFEEADEILLLMLSKGAHDVIHYLQSEAAELPAAQRAKLVAVLSLAGTVQGSVVADWFVQSSDPLAATTRTWLRLSRQDDSIAMLQTVARSPWTGSGAAELRRRFPNLTWVSLTMVPDGPDGEITERLWAPELRRRVARSSPRYSPTDGLVESAATLLPEGAQVPQWTVAALGSHSVPNGTYLDGSRVAPFTTTPGKEKLRAESGGEIMSAYLRALPRSLLD